MINIVFYGLTTVYFESQRQDGIRCFGYSKDNKTDSVQIVIGLILSEDDIPLGYEVFSGNTFEEKTVNKVIEKLRDKFFINKVIFVGDKGILSKRVLKDITEAGYEYIVAAKLKGMAKKYKEEILNKERLRRINEEIWIGEKEIEGKRVIIGWSQS
ncbi:MAG: IS1634 family transposase, partial [Thermodesulfovibrionaceae bacterium]